MQQNQNNALILGAPLCFQFIQARSVAVGPLQCFTSS